VAFTLLEIMLVLTLLVAIAAMAWPALLGPLASQRLRTAADQVRAAWVSARADAIDSGEIRVFRYQPDSGTYLVVPWEGLDPASESGTSAVAPAATAPASGDSANGFGPGGQHLPDGVSFAAVRQTVDARADQAAAAVGESADGGGQAPPVLFYPDGSTSTVELDLVNDDGRRVTISMRGLTGIVSVSPLSSAEEASP
jgi:type II secretory pathway pseudopilin PulG